jgi:hypothetical protein
MVRPLVSYDDISSPQEKSTFPPAPRPKPSKKRKRFAQQHWDDHAESRPAEMEEALVTLGAHDAERAGKDARETSVDEGSRELTHDEIWDDSALIDVWNAATAEYEVSLIANTGRCLSDQLIQAYHGDGKGWKKEPVVKSALFVFHNIYISARLTWSPGGTMYLRHPQSPRSRVLDTHS